MVFNDRQGLNKSNILIEYARIAQWLMRSAAARHTWVRVPVRAFLLKNEV